MITTIPHSKIKRVAYVLNSGKQAAAAVKAAQGCQYIINGGLFNMSTFKSAGYLTIDGKVISALANPFGFAIKDGKLVYSYGNNVKAPDFLSCAYTPLLRDGKIVVSDADHSKYGLAHRSAMGATKDGDIVLLCEPVNRTLQGIAGDLLKAGCVDAINLDGGDSCQCDFAGQTVTSGRIVHNYVCVWTEEEAPKSYKRGIDVSENNGVIDWEKVKASGIEFAMIRAGVSMRADYKAAQNFAECNRLGIPCGAYWFSYALTPAQAAQEAAVCIATLKPYQIDYPVAFDYEYDSVNYAQKKGAFIGMSEASAMARSFLSVIKAAGYTAINYTNQDYLARYFDAALATECPVWLASWPKSPDPAKPPMQCAIWQYAVGDKGAVPGVDTKVDLNVCYEEYTGGGKTDYQVVQEMAGLSDSTMEFLAGYKYGGELLRKLAEAMK